jgi:hypothetical protein
MTVTGVTTPELPYGPTFDALPHADSQMVLPNAAGDKWVGRSLVTRRQPAGVKIGDTTRLEAQNAAGTWDLLLDLDYPMFASMEGGLQSAINDTNFHWPFTGHISIVTGHVYMCTWESSFAWSHDYGQPLQLDFSVDGGAEFKDGFMVAANQYSAVVNGARVFVAKRTAFVPFRMTYGMSHAGEALVCEPSRMTITELR